MASDLGRKIRAARGYRPSERKENHGTSQPELAELIGIHASTLGRLERGESELAELQQREVLGRVATACGLPIEFFYLDLTALEGISLDDRGRPKLQSGDGRLKTIDERTDDIARDVRFLIEGLLTAEDAGGETPPSDEEPEAGQDHP